MSEFVAPNSQRAIDEAARLGLVVVFPANDELQLDIDDDESYEVYLELLNIVDGYYGVKSVKCRSSKSGGAKRHVTIQLYSPVDNKVRILLQACLGSNRKRELLSFIQELSGDEHPTLFLEKAA